MKKNEPDPEARPGTGALCAEGQADGVPCTERGRDCETCSRAAESREAEKETDDSTLNGW